MEKKSNHRRHRLLLLQKKDFLLQDTVIREEMKMCGLKTQLVLNGLTRSVLYVHTDTGNPIEGLVNCLVVKFALFVHDLRSKLYICMYTILCYTALRSC